MNDVYKTSGLMAFVAILILWYAFAFSILWGWFFVPLGLPAISVPWAIGIATTISMLRSQTYKKSDMEPIGQLGVFLIAPLVSLTIGWVALQWMPA